MDCNGNEVLHGAEDRNSGAAFTVHGSRSMDCVSGYGNMGVLLSVAASCGVTTDSSASVLPVYDSTAHQAQHHHLGSHSSSSFRVNGCFRQFPVHAFGKDEAVGISESSKMAVVDGCGDADGTCSSKDLIHIDSLKSKIASHPLYPQLLTAFMDCQKIGASAEMVAMMEKKAQQTQGLLPLGSVGVDPELDLFMEDYCRLLVRYEEELREPYREAMEFLSETRAELSELGEVAIPDPDENGMSSSEDELHCNLMEFQDPNQHSEEMKELKLKLLRKYSGCFANLRKEFLKKKKKGKLPKTARQKLLDWWDAHHKWPYPCETEKASLAQSTGLDQKQINNWFINQRKRHWKPSEDMQLVILDRMNPHPPSYIAGSTSTDW